MKTRFTTSDVILSIIAYSIVIFAVIITLYPLIYVFSASISQPQYVADGSVRLFPKGLYFETYKLIFKERELWTSYYNTIWYTVIGTALSVMLTMLAAYPLSRNNFPARRFYTFVITFTMFFSGGLIPSFILITKLGLYNTRWAMVIPGLISVWNLIICRTYLVQNIAEELLESCKIEGASEFRILRSIVFPLSKPILATLVIFYGVAQWNSFFPALIYLRDATLYPLQLYLRKIVLAASPEIVRQFNSQLDPATAARFNLFLQIKYAVIFVSVMPILMIYPFMQKHFVRGIMIGSLKG